MQPGPDPYQPLGCLGWDPNVPLGPNGHIRLHLIKMLTSSAAMAKHGSDAARIEEMDVN